MSAWDRTGMRTRAPSAMAQDGLATSHDLPKIQPATGSVGACKLVCELASGGMGTVYAARRDHGDGLARTVALKIIRPHLASNPEFTEMFLAEARVQSSINHPYVCKLLDLGIVNGTP